MTNFFDDEEETSPDTDGDMPEEEMPTVPAEGEESVEPSTSGE